VAPHVHAALIWNVYLYVQVSKSNVLSLLDASALLAIADLGLKLDSQKSKLDVMVIDHVEGPSEN